MRFIYNLTTQTLFPCLIYNPSYLVQPLIFKVEFKHCRALLFFSTSFIFLHTFCCVTYSGMRKMSGAWYPVCGRAVIQQDKQRNARCCQTAHRGGCVMMGVSVNCAAFTSLTETALSDFIKHKATSLWTCILGNPGVKTQRLNILCTSRTFRKIWDKTVDICCDS